MLIEAARACGRRTVIGGGPMWSEVAPCRTAALDWGLGVLDRCARLGLALWPDGGADGDVGGAAGGVDEAALAAAVDAAEGAIGYRFTDRSLLSQALRHSSHSDSRVDSNERLEFLGDAVLGLVVCEQIYGGFPELLEGEMTKIKSAAVSRRVCAEIAEELGLDELLVLGKGMLGQGKLPRSLAAGVLESVAGAMFEDGGWEAVRAFLGPLVARKISAAAESGHQNNWKSVLQQHAQQEHASTPVYTVLDEKGPDHAKCFKIAVELSGVVYEASWGQSKKQAEQAAALNALRAMGVYSEEVGAAPAEVPRDDAAVS